MNDFSRRIRPFVDAELARAREARQRQQPDQEFSHLEQAHVLGQSSTWQHVRVHSLMLAWSLRQRDLREGLGQVMRILGAATKTAFGWVPTGNTGGANVSPFRSMPITPEQAALIDQARSGNSEDRTD